MSKSKVSTLLVCALAALALGTSGCKKKSSGSDPGCTLAPLDGACTVNGDCCSGTCSIPAGATQGTCVASASQCRPQGDPCATPGDCCPLAGGVASACNGTCIDPNGGFKDLGLSCTGPLDCCSGSCEGGICAKPSTICHLLADTCGANPDCCSGYCNAGRCDTPAVPTCFDPGVTCNADGQCCSGACDLGTQKCANDGGMCAYPGETCGSDAQCCSHNCPNAGTVGATCSSSVCLQENQSCLTDGQCCSGVCGVGAKCAPLPPGASGSTCKTLGDACTVGTDCCSTNCKAGTCMAVAACDAPGDICYRAQDCCSGLCGAPASPGEPGRCLDAPGGCGQDGVPCAADSQCCTRKCLDLGAGAMACQPAGGCRMTGDYCDHTFSCCGGTNATDPTQPNPYGVFCDGTGTHPGYPEWDTRTQDDHTCTGGQSCNPPGNICGYKASQNCCYDGGGSGKAVCKPDANGILRCFGGPVNTTCPTGWDANDPQCCIQQGAVCQFRDQCCGGAPCIPDASGVLRCAEADTCLPAGSICAPSGAGSAPSPDPCCAGTTCRQVNEVGWACTTASGSCALSGQACNAGTPCCFGTCDPTAHTCGADCAAVGTSCSTNAQCCSGVCEGGFCRAACVQETGTCTVTADCCSGLTCNVPPGATSGTCKGSSGPVCASTGQSCTLTSDCCNAPTDTCTGGVCTPPPSCAQNLQACTAGGTGSSACCTGLSCVMYDAFEQEIPCTSGGSCFCDAQCVSTQGGQCSTLVPCCGTSQLRCADLTPTHGTCTSTDLSQCQCVTTNL